VAGRFYVASALVPIGPRSREPKAGSEHGFTGKFCSHHKTQAAALIEEQRPAFENDF
jgi:hypothetical protein